MQICHQLIAKNSSKRKSSKACNKLYDAITVIITLIDLITDILVITLFYYSRHGTVFFWSALSFVILTNICYVVLAILTFCSSLTRIKQIVWFLLLLPISPILPFLIYCASFPNSWIAINIIDKFGLERIDWDHRNNNKNNSNNNNNTSWKRFTSEKLITNTVFIIEALCESFFLSIIQIIAMVSFEEYRNSYILISICFSLLSIIWKSILVSSGVSIKSSIYKWLCFITDFYAILFVMISWAFLSIHKDDINDNCDFLGLLNISDISFLGYIYIYKILFLVCPLVLFVVLLLIFELGIDSIHDFICWNSRPFVLLIICYVPFVIIVIFLLICLSLIISVIIFEFLMFSWSAYFVEKFFNVRYKWLDKPVFWNVIVNNFLLINVKNKKDLVLRLCIVNYILSQTTESEWVTRMYVDFNSFMSINEFRVFHDPKYQMSLKKLRNQFRNSNYRSSPTMFGSIWRCYCDHIRNLAYFSFQECFINITWFFILFIGIPFYLFSRIITLIYPFFCVFYIIFNNNHNHISFKTNFQNLFCLTTTFIYLLLIIILISIGYKLYGLMHILWHIMPGHERLVKSLIVDNLDYIAQLNAMYNFHVNRPTIFKILANKFSNDVGKIITLYLPKTYYQNIRAEKPRHGRRRKRTLSRNNSVYSSINECSTSTVSLSTNSLFAIDSVQPLPPNNYKYRPEISQNQHINRRNSTDSDDNDLITMTVPQIAIPIDCDDPLSLLRDASQRRKSFS